MDVTVKNLENMLAEARSINRTLEEELEALGNVPAEMADGTGKGKVLAMQEALLAERQQREELTQGNVPQHRAPMTSY